MGPSHRQELPTAQVQVRPGALWGLPGQGPLQSWAGAGHQLAASD